jgi:hypothetical protein
MPAAITGVILVAIPGLAIPLPSPVEPTRAGVKRMATPEQNRWILQFSGNPALVPPSAAAAAPATKGAPASPSGNGQATSVDVTDPEIIEAPAPDPHQAPEETPAASPARARPAAPAPDPRSLPNAGGCWKELAAWDSAAIVFCEVLAEANPDQTIDLSALNKALDAGGLQVESWCGGDARSVAQLSTGYAAAEALGVLIACMDKDAAADKQKLQIVQKRKAALDQALAKTKNLITQQPKDAPLPDGTNPSVPNVDRCWRESAAMEKALLTFAGALADASAKAKAKAAAQAKKEGKDADTSLDDINIKTVMRAIGAGGADITRWCVSTGNVGNAFIAGYAASAAIQALADCMAKDKDADQGTQRLLKQRKATLDQALAQAKQQLRDDWLEGDGSDANDNNMGSTWSDYAAIMDAATTFARLASVASGEAVETQDVIDDIHDKGTGVVRWIVAGGDTGALLAAAYALSDAIGTEATAAAKAKDVSSDKAPAFTAMKAKLDQYIEQAKQTLKQGQSAAGG